MVIKVIYILLNVARAINSVEIECLTCFLHIIVFDLLCHLKSSNRLGESKVTIVFGLYLLYSSQNNSQFLHSPFLSLCCKSEWKQNAQFSPVYENISSNDICFSLGLMLVISLKYFSYRW
jgi:hypothetical protein